MRGMSIRTGQTSAQAPQSDEAYGRDDARSMPTRSGVRIAPIGPGYTEPYAWPPVRSYTGQTLRHAEQRMQRSAWRRTRSAGTSVRPLSRGTRWNVWGPSPAVAPVHTEV